MTIFQENLKPHILRVLAAVRSAAEQAERDRLAAEQAQRAAAQIATQEAAETAERADEEARQATALSLYLSLAQETCDSISGLTPYEYICKIWTSEPDRFILNPIHQMPGLNN